MLQCHEILPCIKAKGKLMSCLDRCKNIVLFFGLGTAMLFAAGFAEKKFDVETGMVHFSISGAGVLTDDTNISIEGKGKLRFKNWGVEALVEEQYKEITTGTIHHIHRVHVCEKFENKQRFDVDFETKKILERPMPKGNFKEYYLKGMEKTGQETIAGYTCDVWEGEGVKKCLYKGIPLLVEHYLLGIYYQKKAVEVVLDIKPEPSKCLLPDYPVEKFSLFKTNIKTKSIKPPKEFASLLVRVNKEMHEMFKMNDHTEDDMSEKQKQYWRNKIGKNIFEAEKVLLPKMLEAMKKTRVCLQQAETADAANACLLSVLALKKEVSEDTRNHIDSWTPEVRTKVMDEFDENIVLLQSEMKCIRSTKSLSELSHCIERK